MQIGIAGIGKMGAAIAEAALDRGAQVTVIAANAEVPFPPGATVLPVESNADMRTKLERTVRKRASEFPRASHYGLFAHGDTVEVVARIAPSRKVAARSRRVKIRR